MRRGVMFPVGFGTTDRWRETCALMALWPAGYIFFSDPIVARLRREKSCNVLTVWCVYPTIGELYE